MDLVGHLKQRHLDLELHRPVLDHAESLATFFLWNLSGQMVGFQQYRPGADKAFKNDPRLARYFTFVGHPTVAVWGLESLDLTPDVVFITEGIFDAARLTQRGVSALAVLSNNPSTDVKNWLRCLPRRRIAVCDNDAAGRRLARCGDVAVLTPGKDLGESPEEFVSDLIRRFVRR